MGSPRGLVYGGDIDGYNSYAQRGNLYTIEDVHEAGMALWPGLTFIDPILGIACPNILYPYVREVVSDIVVRAGFPPVMLTPVNFEALFQAQKQAQAEQQKEASPIIQATH